MRNARGDGLWPWQADQGGEALRVTDRSKARKRGDTKSAAVQAPAKTGLNSKLDPLGSEAEWMVAP